MRYSPPLERATLHRRYKRFLADVALEGEVIVVHCANPGRMTTCAPEGAAVWLHDSQNDARKLRYTWELVRVGGDIVCVNTARANALVADALTAGMITELTGYSAIAREVPLGGSRIDFLLEGGRGRCWVEVKTVTLRSGKGECAFPDAVTSRGLKHLAELMSAVRGGDRAVLLFACLRSNTSSIRPADEIDPEYAACLRQAIASGVEVLGYSADISPQRIELAGPIPVVTGEPLAHRS